MSDRKHWWILTMIDFDTRYAIATTPIEIVDVAQGLVSIFAGVGIPREMRPWKSVYFRSHERDYSTFVDQAVDDNIISRNENGLLEKFNGTLNAMLNRTTHERPGYWDRYIPALLFAYREVLQESLKLSPFVLLCGLTVRGPMSILRELWTGEVTSDEKRTTYQYVMELREHTEETCRLAHEELKKAKVNQKEYYNRNARGKCLSVGDKVLLLLPTDINKLLLQWKGPYDIIQKVDVMTIVYRSARTPRYSTLTCHGGTLVEKRVKTR